MRSKIKSRPVRLLLSVAILFATTFAVLAATGAPAQASGCDRQPGWTYSWQYRGDVAPFVLLSNYIWTPTWSACHDVNLTNIRSSTGSHCGWFRPYYPFATWPDPMWPVPNFRWLCSGNTWTYAVVQSWEKKGQWLQIEMIPPNGDGSGSYTFSAVT